MYMIRKNNVSVGQYVSLVQRRAVVPQYIQLKTETLYY